MAFLENIRSISLSILIWGRNTTKDSLASTKRQQIRDRLIGLGHNAMFSEEFTASDLDPVSQKSREFAQALASHLIIILPEDSPGALAEAHDFCNHPEIAAKVFVLMPRRYSSGYSAKGAIRELEEAYGGVYWYDQEELVRCTVLERAILRVEALRQIQYRFHCSQKLFGE